MAIVEMVAMGEVLKVVARVVAMGEGLTVEMVVAVAAKEVSNADYKKTNSTAGAVCFLVVHSSDFLKFLVPI